MTDTRKGASDSSRILRQLAEAYTEVLRESVGESLVSVVLFGSVARNEAQPASDVDLLVVAEGLPASRLARQDILRSADERIDPELHRLARMGILTDFRPILKTPVEARQVTALYLDLVEDAILLYDRDGFFARVLAGLRQSLERLGARRIQRGTLRYWDLKPDYRPGEAFEV
jgi:predicted nucleotidyltransferase